MFRCQLCQNVAPEGTHGHKLVTRTRSKNYASRGTPPYERSWGRQRHVRRRQPFDKGGEGTEIVQEILVCPTCAQRHSESTV
jgi:hypothetical protein